MRGAKSILSPACRHLVCSTVRSGSRESCCVLEAGRDAAFASGYTGSRGELTQAIRIIGDPRKLSRFNAQLSPPA
jgi:hypothetical protein